MALSFYRNHKIGEGSYRFLIKTVFLNFDLHFLHFLEKYVSDYMENMDLDSYI